MYKKNLFLKKLKNLKGKKFYCNTSYFFNKNYSDDLERNFDFDGIYFNDLYNFVKSKTGFELSRHHISSLYFDKKEFKIFTSNPITLSGKKFLKLKFKITSDFKFIIVKKVEVYEDDIYIIENMFY